MQACTTRLTSSSQMFGFWYHLREPRKQRMADLVNANDIFVLINCMQSLYRVPCRFSDKSWAILLYTASPSRPIPPLIENTIGEKLPFSMSRTLCPYARFFSFSLVENAWTTDPYRLAKGLNTLMSKNAFWYGNHSPRALTSSLAASVVMVDRCAKVL